MPPGSCWRKGNNKMEIPQIIQNFFDIFNTFFTCKVHFWRAILGHVGEN